MGGALVERKAIADGLRGVDEMLNTVRAMAGRVLNALQLRIRVLEARVDPSLVEWRHEVEIAVENGTIERRLQDQPSLEEIVERRLVSAAS
jgi:hypothetical protein